MSKQSRRDYLKVLEGQRKIFLAELNKDGELDENYIREQVYQIDLEEERIKLL